MTGDNVAPADDNGRRSLAAHWGGFIASGLIAFLVDGAVLEAGIRLLHFHPLLARLLAISAAMVAAWLSHRTLTFALQSRPTATEFVRYAAMAWTAAAINYGTFASILLFRPGTWPLAALALSCVAAGIFSYLAMRFGVFRGRR